MNKLFKSIMTTYLVIKYTPKVIKGGLFIADIIARGIISKIDDVLDETDVDRKRTRRHLRRSFYRGY